MEQESQRSLASAREPQGALVSVSLPVYNGQNYIREAVDSMRAQDYTNFELIITDNASTDGTAAICRSYATADSRIKYYRNECNIGAAPNYNRGLELCSGAYFMWLAHDDWLSPNYFSSCVKALQDNPEAVLACGKPQGVDGEGRPCRLLAPATERLTGPSPERRLFQFITNSGGVYEIFGLYRMDVMRKLPRFDTSYYLSDRAIVAAAALLGPCLYLTDAVFYNRDHSRRSGAIKDKRKRAQWQNAQTRNRLGLEHWSYLLHVMRIAADRTYGANVFKAEALILLWSLSPSRLARLLIEIVGFVSPRLQARLREIGWSWIGRLDARRARLRGHS